MSFKDKDLVCSDCGNTFVFTTGEQEFFAEKGFTNEPKRCPKCRDINKRKRSSFQNRNRRTHKVKCSECGGEATVPFQPRGDRPVYCNTCYSAKNS